MSGFCAILNSHQEQSYSYVAFQTTFMLQLFGFFQTQDDNIEKNIATSPTMFFSSKVGKTMRDPFPM